MRRAFMLLLPLLLVLTFVPSAAAAPVAPARLHHHHSRSYGWRRTYMAPDGDTVDYKCRWDGVCVCDADHDNLYTRGECAALPAGFNRRRALWRPLANLLVAGVTVGIVALALSAGRRGRTPPPSPYPPSYMGGGGYGYRPY